MNAFTLSIFLSSIYCLNKCDQIIFPNRKWIRLSLYRGIDFFFTLVIFIALDHALKKFSQMSVYYHEFSAVIIWIPYVYGLNQSNMREQVSRPHLMFQGHEQLTLSYLVE